VKGLHVQEWQACKKKKKKKSRKKNTFEVLFGVAQLFRVKPTRMYPLRIFSRKKNFSKGANIERY